MKKTPAVGRLESAREQAQARLDGEKSQLERNRLGQFATPPGLARAIARLVRVHWPGSERIRFLDPGVGTGAFYSAVRSEFQKRQIGDAVGVELDPDVAAVARSLWAEDGLHVRLGDFTRMSAPTASNCANLVVANPPYVRHHHLEASDKVRLQRAVAENLGLPVSGLAGLYCYFLLLSDRWMSEGGLGVWLIPSEFFDVNYGRVLREYLATRVTLLRVHRFDASDVQFDDALVSSVVVLFRKQRPEAAHEASFTEGGSLDRPNRTQQVSVTALGKSERWTSFLNGRSQEGETVPRLGDFFRIKRGLATGANNFFILSRERARELRLPERFLKPILPSPRYLVEPIVEVDREGYPLLPEQLVLIDCNVDMQTLKREAPTLHTYIQQGVESGLAERYLASTRQPWYSQEQRSAAPFLCTYMGRGAGKTKPLRFIWNKSKATAPNVYLLLYPTGALLEKLEKQPGTARVVYEFLGAIDAGALRDGGRVYGGGLHKVEPRELANFPAQKLVTTLGLENKRVAQLPLFIVADRQARATVTRTQ